jgi:hypothetical protein
MLPIRAADAPIIAKRRELTRFCYDSRRVETPMTGAIRYDQ